MPTYEYECTACGFQFERFQNMSDKPLASCPKCKQKVRRLISRGAGIIFKGSGFYATDYRKPAYKKDKEQEKPPARLPCGQASSKPACQTCPSAQTRNSQ